MEKNPYIWTCPLCGYVCTLASAPADDWADDHSVAAWHEAGHTVMRWLCNIPVDATCIHPDGSGYSAARPGVEVTPNQEILLLLAGGVAEYGVCMADTVRLQESTTEELTAARSLLTTRFFDFLHPNRPAVEDRLQYYWDETIEALCSHLSLLESLAEELTSQHGALSRRKVSGFFRRKCWREFQDTV